MVNIKIKMGITLLEHLLYSMWTLEQWENGQMKNFTEFYNVLKSKQNPI